MHYVDEDGENHKIGVTINRNAMPYTDEHATLLYEITSNDKLYIGAKFTIDGLVKGNVPLGYFDSDVDGLTVNGVVQRRLMLPEGTPYIDVYPDMSPDEVIEGIVTFDYVYPRKVLSISSVGEEMIDVTEGEEKKPTGMKVPVYTIKTTGLVGFDNSYVISEKLTLTFQTGKLAGLTFGLTFLPEKSDNTSTCFEIVANEDYGGRLPDTVMKPEAGNEFVMAGYDTEYVFENLVPEAEEELKSEAEKYAEKIRNNIGTVSAKLMSDWSKARNEAQETPCPFDVGQKVTVNNPSFFPSPRTMRVLGYELALDIPWDSPVYTIGESASYSRLGALEDKIDSIKLNGSSYFPGKVSSSTSGTNVYLIKKDDETEPSDTNAYSSLRTDKEIKEGIEKNNKELAKKFLSKLNDDTASGIITFLQGLIIGSFSSGESGGQISSDGAAELASLLLRGALSSDNFVQGLLGSGYGLLKKNAAGRSYFEVDELYVRMKAYFDSLEIKHAYHTGGTNVLSPAGMVCSRVMEITDNIVIDAAGEKVYDSEGEPVEEFGSVGRVPAYRCFFVNDDGGKRIVNEFRVGDNAQCRTFNIKEGVYEGVSNQFYWRRVVGVGEDYIDLSDDAGEYMEGSTVPLAEDNIVTVGNAFDASRQNVVVLSAYGEDSPYVAQYAGVNSFSLEGKLVTRISPHGNLFKGNFVMEDGSVVSARFELLDGAIRNVVTDLESHGGSISKLEQRADEITSSVEDLDENLRSEIKQTADSVHIGINNGLKEVGIDIEKGDVNIKGENISLEGAVTANGNFKVLEDGSTESKNGKFEGIIIANEGIFRGYVGKSRTVITETNIGQYLKPVDGLEGEYEIDFEKLGGYVVFSGEFTEIPPLYLPGLSEYYVPQDEERKNFIRSLVGQYVIMYNMSNTAFALSGASSEDFDPTGFTSRALNVGEFASLLCRAGVMNGYEAIFWQRRIGKFM